MVRKIPFLDLKKINSAYEDELKNAVNRIVSSGWYLLGEELKTLEQNIVDFHNGGNCVGVSSGFDALVLMLQSHNFPKGSEIIVPANTYIATILAILESGLKPVFTEPLLNTYLINPTLIEEKITEKTKAILAVDLYGKCPDLDALKKIASKFKLFLFSDSAQSFGAYFNGKSPSEFYDAMAFSFYPTKNLGALGDAGAVFCQDPKTAEKVKALRNYGSEKKYVFKYAGKNNRMDEIQAAVLNVKIKNQRGELASRQKMAKRYLTEIKNNLISLPPSDSIYNDSWHLFVVRCKNRADFSTHLETNGVGYDIHYPIPPHKQEALKQYNHLVFPITKRIHDEIISLPLNGTLSKDDIDHIIEIVNNYSL
jgi:dTDP-4-amino-4,6-dideoxygalactose transaminase